VAKLAQVRLYYSSNSPAYVRSHTALLSTIQALAYGVYARDMAQYADRIKAFRSSDVIQSGTGAGATIG
jgi:DNA-binding MurR/RpiR family transcriptional regulator